jgi:hypothetical protein
LDGSLYIIVTVSMQESYRARNPLLPFPLARRHPLPPLIVGDDRADYDYDADDAEQKLHSAIIAQPQ